MMKNDDLMIDWRIYVDTAGERFLIDELSSVATKKIIPIYRIAPQTPDDERNKDAQAYFYAESHASKMIRYDRSGST